MKVLNVTSLMDPVTGGGVAERALQVSREMHKLGAEVVNLTLDVGITTEYRERAKDLNIIALPCISKRFNFPLFSYRQIKKLVADCDIVHIMGYWMFLNILVYHAAKKAHKPYTICPAGALPVFGRSKVIKRIYNCVAGIKMVVEAQGPVAVSKNEFPHFMAYGVAADKICVIPNGVNEEDFRLTAPNGFRDKYSMGAAPFLLFVGRLNLIKGPDLLLKAFIEIQAEIPKYHLVFAGPDGGMLSDLQKMTSEAGLSQRIHFLGHISGDDKTGAYRAADLLVIPSRQEAMSIVVLEAGICGTPVLLTDQCGFGEVAEVHGGIVTPASVEGIRNGLSVVLNDKVKLRKMGGALCEYVRLGFTWRKAAEKYLSLSAEIVSSLRPK